MVDGRAAGAGLGSTRQKKAHRPSQALIQTTHAVSPRRSEDALAAGGSRPAAPGVVWLLRRRRRGDRRGVGAARHRQRPPMSNWPAPLERVRPATRLPTRLPPARRRARAPPPACNGLSEAQPPAPPCASPAQPGTADCASLCLDLDLLLQIAPVLIGHPANRPVPKKQSSDKDLTKTCHAAMGMARYTPPCAQLRQRCARMPS